MSAYCYHSCGITFQSELELPGVPQAAPQHKVSARIYFSEVPISLDDAVTRGAAFDAAPEQLLLKSPVGRYLVRAGREIIIQPNADATESETRIFLMGSAFGALLHQQGVLPLHASCVRVGDVCVAFTGVSGAGKSTLAAFLQQRGFTILSDDICPVRVYPGAGAVAFPGFPRLRLWAEALNALGLDTSDFRQPRTELEKYELPTPDAIAQPFVPLRRIYLLCETRDLERDPKGIEAAEGPQRLAAMLANTYRFRYLNGFGRKPEHLRTCAAVLKSISVFRLWRPWRLSHISETLDVLDTHWNDLREADSIRVPDAA